MRIVSSIRWIEGEQGMARAQHEPRRPVSEAERRALTALVKATSARVDQVRRARALRTVAETGNFAEAARHAG
jgi:hypothetical protein